jgi:hypothetical protein
MRAGKAALAAAVVVSWAARIALAAPPPPPPVKTVTPPTTGLEADGALNDKNNKLQTGEPYFARPVKLAANQAYTITLSSRDFTPYLIVTPAGARQIDRAAAKGVATLWLVAPADGDATVIATTDRPSDKGKYHLSVKLGLFAGDLGAGDAALDSGEFYKALLVWLPGAPFTVRLASTAFTPYLIARVEGVDTQVAADLGNPGTARAVLAPKAAGPVLLQVTSRAKGEKGAFQLTLKPGIDAPITPQSSKGRLEAGHYEEGGTDKSPGKWTDGYSFIGAKGVQYKVSLKPDGFAPTLVVIDAGGGRNEGKVAGGVAGVTLTNPADGVCQVVVQSAEPGKGGAYEVIVEPILPAIAAP